MPDDVQTASDFYGPGTVTGSAADAGKAITLQTTGTHKMTVGAEENPSEDPKERTPDEEGTEEGAESDEQEETLEDVELAIRSQVDANRAIAEELTAKGVDWGALEKEFTTKGDLGKETREALEKVGYPQPVVDAYLNGLIANAERFETQVFKIAGGKKEYKLVANHITAQGDAAVNAFNQALDTGNLKLLEMLITSAKGQMTRKNGTANPTVTGKGKPTSGPQGFASRAEMIKAMSDSRYGRDPMYTHEVERKTLKTTL